MTTVVEDDRIEQDGWTRLKPGSPDPYAFVPHDGHQWAYQSSGWGFVLVGCSCGWVSGDHPATDSWRRWVEHVHPGCLRCGVDAETEREMAYAWGRDEERARVVASLREQYPDSAAADAIERGEHRG